MTKFLSAPAFHAHKLLKAAGCPLSRAQIFDVYAAMFAYHNHGEMDRDRDTIEYALNQEAYVVLSTESAMQRMAKSGCAQMPASQLYSFAQIMLEQLRPVLPPKSFSDENQFFRWFTGTVLRQAVLESDLVQQEQVKVADYCDVFELSDADVPPLLDERGDYWTFNVLGSLYHKLPSGEPAKDADQIATNSNVIFAKFGRVLLAPYPTISTGAGAWRPHPSMGGVSL